MPSKKSEYGRGSIRQMGKRWQIRYYADTVGEGGQRIRRRVTESFKTKAEARKRLNAVVGAIAEGRHQLAADQLGFSDIEQMVLDHYDRRKSIDHVRRRAGAWRC